MTRGLQLVLPGLFDLPLAELEPGFADDRLPRLNRLLGLATPLANDAYTIDAMLQRALALPRADTASGLPMAQAFADAADEGGRLLLFEAIHLRADLQNATAVPIPGEPENLKDIDIIINDLKEEFKADFDVSAAAPGLYLLRLKAFEPPTHYPHPLSVLGKSINPFIEQSRRVLPWYRLLNEIQMFMHQHPVNAQRLRQRRLAINSLWAWGAGAAAAPARRPAWFCDDPVFNRFAGSLGLCVEPSANIENCAAVDAAVIVDLRLLQLLKSGDCSPLDRLLLDIEGDLLSPLFGALARQPTRLLLRAGFRFDFELKPSARLKFWRRRGSLAAWIK
jgi:hypothetical protein